MAIDPKGTGCISSVGAGGFLPRTHTMVARFSYAGAPTAPDPRSVFSGDQLTMINTDGAEFPGGKRWKCITCGVPAANRVGGSGGYGYIQPFDDGSRILAGTSVIDCSPYKLIDARCTPAVTRIYPVRWNVTTDGSGPGGSISGMKLHPDNIHVAWNRIATPTKPGESFDEFAYFGRLVFNPRPTTGTPLTARYDVTKVTGLYSADVAKNGYFFSVDPAHRTRLRFEQQAAVGEFKGFVGDGRAIIGIGNARSDNLDHFATSLTTGLSRRLDSNPGYSDPATSSPNGDGTVAMDVRGQNRFWFIGGLPGVPPITDMLPTGAAVSAGYRIRDRRLFEPYLVSRHADHDQQLNACTTGPCSTLASGPGSTADDPLWASRADAYWSPDGTAIVYPQTYPDPADCGPPFDPVPCPPSTEPGGRRSRLMLARLTGRDPLPPHRVSPASDTVPWGTPYHPGDATPTRPHLPAGAYTLKGKKSGTATIRITENQNKTNLTSISVSYRHFSDDGVNIIQGTEDVQNQGTATSDVTFHEDLTLSGRHTGRKFTSEPGGYTVSPLSAIQGTYRPVGTMTTIIDGRTYNQPPSVP